MILILIYCLRATARSTVFLPTASATRVPRAPLDSCVVSYAVWCSIMALSSAPSEMTMEESHFHVIKPDHSAQGSVDFVVAWQNVSRTARVVRHSDPADRRKRATSPEPAPLRRLSGGALGEQKKSRIHTQPCCIKAGITRTLFVVNVAYRSCLPGVPMWPAASPSRTRFLCSTFGETLGRPFWHLVAAVSFGEKKNAWDDAVGQGNEANKWQRAQSRRG